MKKILILTLSVSLLYSCGSYVTLEKKSTASHDTDELALRFTSSLLEDSREHTGTVSCSENEVLVVKRTPIILETYKKEVNKIDLIENLLRVSSIPSSANYSLLDERDRALSNMLYYSSQQPSLGVIDRNEASRLMGFSKIYFPRESVLRSSDLSRQIVSRAEPYIMDHSQNIGRIISSFANSVPQNLLQSGTQVLNQASSTLSGNLGRLESGYLIDQALDQTLNINPVNEIFLGLMNGSIPLPFDPNRPLNFLQNSPKVVSFFNRQQGLQGDLGGGGLVNISGLYLDPMNALGLSKSEVLVQSFCIRKDSALHHSLSRSSGYTYEVNPEDPDREFIHLAVDGDGFIVIDNGLEGFDRDIKYIREGLFYVDSSGLLKLKGNTGIDNQDYFIMPNPYILQVGPNQGNTVTLPALRNLRDISSIDIDRAANVYLAGNHIGFIPTMKFNNSLFLKEENGLFSMDTDVIDHFMSMSMYEPALVLPLEDFPELEDRHIYDLMFDYLLKGGSIVFPEDYLLGDIGPAGGIIYAAPGSRNNNSAKYFEVSLVDLGDYDWNSAVNICLDHYSGGYYDWFLPAESQINGLNNFLPSSYATSGIYWTSSELGENLEAAATFDFEDMQLTINFSDKSSLHNTRCVRSFSPYEGWAKELYKHLAGRKEINR